MTTYNAVTLTADDGTALPSLARLIGTYNAHCDPAFGSLRLEDTTLAIVAPGREAETAYASDMAALYCETPHPIAGLEKTARAITARYPGITAEIREGYDGDSHETTWRGGIKTADTRTTQTPTATGEEIVAALFAQRRARFTGHDRVDPLATGAAYWAARDLALKAIQVTRGELPHTGT